MSGTYKATIEKVYSLMNNTWLDEMGRENKKTIKSQIDC